MAHGVVVVLNKWFMVSFVVSRGEDHYRDRKKNNNYISLKFIIILRSSQLQDLVWACM